MIEPRYVTTVEAAEALGITVARIHALLREGRITGARKIGARRGTWIMPAKEDGKPEVKPHPLRPRQYDKIDL